MCVLVCPPSREASPKQIHLNPSWHLTEGSASQPLGHSWPSLENFCFHYGAVPASGARPGMLLNIPQCMGQSSRANFLAQNVSGAEVEKAWLKACTSTPVGAQLYSFTWTPLSFLKDQCIAIHFLINDILLEFYHSCDNRRRNCIAGETNWINLSTQVNISGLR